MFVIAVVEGAPHRPAISSNSVNLDLHESCMVICSFHDSITIAADPSSTGGKNTIQTEPPLIYWSSCSHLKEKTDERNTLLTGDSTHINTICTDILNRILNNIQHFQCQIYIFFYIM